jgi:hypothetical protein
MIVLDFISGLVFGIEHISGDEEDDFQFLIGIHLGVIRLTWFKF